MREGFKETFQPLIESQDAVKTSIDTQQNKLIEQLALTEGLNKNRLAVTSGFDKMDEVKLSDLKQLPGFEAIEHPEIKETEENLAEPGYWISNNDLKLLLGGEESDFTPEDEEISKITKEYFDEILSQDKLNFDKYRIKVDLDVPRIPLVKVVERDYGEKTERGVVTFLDSDLDRGLLKTKTANILNKLKLPYPSKIKNEKLEVIKLYQKNAEVHLDFFRDLLKNKAVFYTEKGVNKAKALNIDPRKDTVSQIKNYNVLGEYINNISKLETYAEKTGQGIIHFNNPLQLLDRLELLIGSLNAGNNGVKQEFTQIAHLLHQLKVITKKQLNDFLKKYILSK